MKFNEFIKQEYIKEEESPDVDKMMKEVIESKDDLEKQISDILETPIKFEAEIESGRSKKWISFMSNNLIDKTGIMKHTCKSIKIGTFNSSLSTATKEDGKDVDPYYWMTIKFHYEFLSGGTNGSDFLTVWYRFKDKKWEISKR